MPWCSATLITASPQSSLCTAVVASTGMRLGGNNEEWYEVITLIIMALVTTPWFIDIRDQTETILLVSNLGGSNYWFIIMDKVFINIIIIIESFVPL